MTTGERLKKPEHELTATQRRNRRMMAVVLIVFASLYQQAAARIGETPEECQTRYGNPIIVDKDKNASRFKKGEMLVTVFFYNDRADCICYEKSDVNSKGRHIKLSENEIQYLLEINGGDKKWKERKTIAETTDSKKRETEDGTWETEDGELLATYFILVDNFSLYIQTKDYKAREETRRKAEEDKRKAEEAELKAKEAKSKAEETELKAKTKTEVTKSLEGL